MNKSNVIGSGADVIYTSSKHSNDRNFIMAIHRGLDKDEMLEAKILYTPPIPVVVIKIRDNYMKEMLEITFNSVDQLDEIIKDLQEQRNKLQNLQ